MPDQSAHAFLVAYKSEVTFNVAPTNTGAFRFRPNGGNGLEWARQTVIPGEIRSDLQPPMPRLGSGRVSGSFPCDLSVGSFDQLLEAALRGTWSSAVVITQATATSITTEAGPPSTITRAAGSWITDGARVGDIATITNQDAGNNNRRLRVTALTATVMTVVPLSGNLVTNNTPDTTFEVTLARKVTNLDVPVRRSFYIEQYYQDIDQSIVFGGCRVASLSINGGPDDMAVGEFGFMGASATALATGASPFYSNPTLSGTIALVFADASLREAGGDVVKLTGFNLALDLGVGVQPVIGSIEPTDIFDNRLNVTGSISAIRGDLTRFTRFKDETEFEFHAVLVEPESEPKDHLSIFIPRLKLVSVSAPFGGDNAIVETMQFVVGKKEGVPGYENTTIKFSTSAV